MLHRVREENGFTLMELLTAILVIAVLAAIAIPSFLSKRVKAGDAVAKELVHTAEQAAVTYGLSSSYTTMTPTALNAVERSINITANGQAVLVAAGPTTTGYLLSVVSSNANTFNLTSTSGSLTRSCIVASGNGNTATNTGGGCISGTW